MGEVVENGTLPHEEAEAAADREYRKAFAEPDAALQKGQEERGEVKEVDTHELQEPLSRLSVVVRRDRLGVDPYTAAISEEADLADHHVLTLMSRATRLGAATINAGAKSLGITQLTDEADRNKVRSAYPKGDGSSIRTIAHVPQWAKRVAKRRVRESTSYVPLLTFRNPWPSFKSPGLFEAWHGGLRWGLPRGYEEGNHSSYRGRGKRTGALPRDDDIENVTVVKPAFATAEAGREDDSRGVQAEVQSDSVRVTWLGHATTLVQFPGPGGLNVLFDPIFVSRASPSQAAGPIRYTEPPCSIDELPRIDVVCISHNHYDHLSADCMRQLREREMERQSHANQQPQSSPPSTPGESGSEEEEKSDEKEGETTEDRRAKPKDADSGGSKDKDIKKKKKKSKGLKRATGLKVLCGLGNVGFFKDIGFQEDEVIECDWWDEVSLRSAEHKAIKATHFSASSPPQPSQSPPALRIVCTPAQHGSGRSASDQNVTLWASWLLIHGEASTASGGAKDEASGFRVFFAGDTGLRAHNSSRKRRSHFPTCPAFEEVARKYSVPQLLLLPISVGSSLSFFRSWDPFPRRFSPFPRVEAAMTSAIHMDAEDAADCHVIMSLAEQASKSVSPAEARGDDGDEKEEQEKAKIAQAKKARRGIEKRGITSLAVHCQSCIPLFCEGVLYFSEVSC